LIEKLAALVPPPHAHLVHYSGCLAPNSKLRAQLIPTPRQQGAHSEEAKTKATLRPHSGAEAPYWSWARLLGRVFALDMSRCLFCQRGALHIIAAITQEEVTTRILRHLKLASVPPPVAPARRRQAIFAFDEGPVSVGA
jgi:hypothetical protein